MEEYVWSRGANGRYTVHVAWEHDRWAVEVRHPPTPRRSSKNLVLERSGWHALHSDTLPSLLADVGFCPHAWCEYHRLLALDGPKATMLDVDELLRRWQPVENLSAELPTSSSEADDDRWKVMAGTPLADIASDDDDPFAIFAAPPHAAGRGSATPGAGGRSDRYVESLIDTHRDAIHAATERRTLRTCAVLTVDHDGTCVVDRKELDPDHRSEVYACARRLAAAFHMPVVIHDRPADETFVTTVLAPPPAS
jgi:hypothetical protein